MENTGSDRIICEEEVAGKGRQGEVATEDG